KLERVDEALVAQRLGLVGLGREHPARVDGVADEGAEDLGVAAKLLIVRSRSGSMPARSTEISAARCRPPPKRVTPMRLPRSCATLCTSGLVYSQKRSQGWKLLIITRSAPCRSAATVPAPAE